jgi:hypothetical protein
MEVRKRTMDQGAGYFGYLQNEVGKYFYAERKIYSVLCKKWLKNITTHDMLFHAI